MLFQRLGNRNLSIVARTNQAVLENSVTKERVELFAFALNSKQILDICSSTNLRLLIAAIKPI